MQILFRPFIDWGVFEGRTARHEFWVFYLFWSIVGFFFGTVMDQIIFNMDSFGLVRVLSFIGGVAFFYILITKLAIITRRFHDMGRSAWFLLLFLIPLFGNLVILVFMLLPGEKRSNIYGDGPNARDAIEDKINNNLKEKELL